MNKESYIRNLFSLIIFFIGIPILLFVLGEYPRRSTLLETLSLITIMGFSLLISQFFSSRINKGLVKKIRMVNVLRIHTFIGYVFISILLLHPFFLIVPKFFDNAVTPVDAFLKLITTFDSLGVVLGLIAYAALVTLLVTAFFRFKLHLKYKSWRNLHAYLTLLFVIVATWHVIALGRHSNMSFSIFYVLTVASGIFNLLRVYLFKTSTK